MAESVQVQSLSHRHEAVMNWLILNPERNLRQCADELGYTQSWLSTLIHSDIFQAKLKERQDIVFSVVAADVPEKLRGLASIVTDQMAEMLEKNTDKNFTLDSFDKIMHRAGYAPASARNPGGNPAVQVNNTFVVSREELAQARASMQTVVQEPEVLPPPPVTELVQGL